VDEHRHSAVRARCECGPFLTPPRGIEPGTFGLGVGRLASDLARQSQIRTVVRGELAVTSAESETSVGTPCSTAS
jgi:hypothetical protein